MDSYKIHHHQHLSPTVSMCTAQEPPHRRRKRRKRRKRTNFKPQQLATPSISIRSKADYSFPMLRISPLNDALTCLIAFIIITVVSILQLFHGIDAHIGRDWAMHISNLRAPVLHTRLKHSEASSTLATQEMLRADHDARWGYAHALGRREPVEAFLRWLHIPKTGTSFVNTLLRWGCRKRSDLFVVPRLERPRHMPLVMLETFSWDWLFHNESGRAWLRKHCGKRLVTKHPVSGELHYALYMHRALKRWEVDKAVAMFRLPLQRMYSNYLHLNLHYNETREFQRSLHEFLQKPKFWSQQTKLLLGRNYRDERALTESDGKRAALLVERLKFVGLTEEFELSCRLFHARFGGVPHRAQFENVRPGIFRYRTKAERSSSFRYDESQFNEWTDPADDIVYEAARARFWNEVETMKSEIEKDGLGPVHLNNRDIGYRENPTQSRRIMRKATPINKT